MNRIQVLLLLMVAMSGVNCNGSKNKEKEAKRTVKPFELNKIVKKSTNGKRQSAELEDLYPFGQKEEPYRPISQFHYQGATEKDTSANYVIAASNQELSFNKPDAGTGINAGYEHGTINNRDINDNGGSMPYRAANANNAEKSNQYASGSYKPSYGGGSQYASSAYRGPFIVASYQAPDAQARNHARPTSPGHHPPAPLAIPINYGGSAQPLPTQPHHQNQYAIAFPAEYIRHYQQNLASTFPLHGAQMIQLIYAQSAGSPSQSASANDLKDKKYGQSAIHYVPLTPYLTASQGVQTSAVGGAMVTHIIPYFGSGGQKHQQAQQAPPAAFYYGASNQQMPSTSLTYDTTLPHQQHTIQKQQIYGPFQIAEIGTIAVASLPLKPMIDPVQQPSGYNQFYQNYHPDAPGYTQYSQSSSISNGSGSSSNQVEIPSYGASSTSAAKESPLYSSPTLTNPENTYSSSPESNRAKVAYTYGSDPNYEGPIYAHPGAIHYGTHLYHNSRKVVQIGSNRVTAGSAAVAGVSPSSFYPQQQSTANNSQGSRGSSTSVVKFA
ncbi:uncharacterized protein LOC129912757 [Episyrphus balteatus]|uniref:uncharacterized protein LOC129912757 n=1 Tax=Episyrphus balteatus TaxID=286459 RepID=UPI002484E1B0|nr:uncharacterized protein LOC129912757 [Episyrphus balteatus]XP_055847130.1 uncharacterized protein LOC129912757 [Episyrphus balteatus]